MGSTWRGLKVKSEMDFSLKRDVRKHVNDFMGRLSGEEADDLR